jgi:hypothetical protein
MAEDRVGVEEQREEVTIRLDGIRLDMVAGLDYSIFTGHTIYLQGSS